MRIDFIFELLSYLAAMLAIEISINSKLLPAMLAIEISINSKSLPANLFRFFTFAIIYSKKNIVNLWEKEAELWMFLISFCIQFYFYTCIGRVLACL